MTDQTQYDYTRVTLPSNMEFDSLIDTIETRSVIMEALFGYLEKSNDVKPFFHFWEVGNENEMLARHRRTVNVAKSLVLSDNAVFGLVTSQLIVKLLSVYDMILKAKQHGRNNYSRTWTVDMERYVWLNCRSQKSMANYINRKMVEPCRQLEFLVFRCSKRTGNMYLCPACKRLLNRALFGWCTRCRAIQYCSKECQREHYSRHRTLCKSMQDD